MPSPLRVAGAVTAAILCLPYTAASAVGWETAVAVPMTVEHDTNPQLDSQNKKAVTRTIVAPDYNLVGVSDSDQWQFGFGLHLERSSDQSVSLDREDPKFRLGWQRETETGGFGLLAKYDESSSLTTGLEETGTQTLKDGTRTTQALAGNWSTAITERNTLAADTEYRTVSFDDDTQTDFDDLSAGVTWSHALSERLEPFARLAVTRYEPKEGGVGQGPAESSNSYSPAVGIKFEMSEQLQGSLRAGGNKVSNGGGGLNWQGGMDVRYVGERFEVSVDAGRSTVVSSEGGFTEVKQLRTSFSYAVDELTRAGFDASWQDNKGEQPNTMQQYSAWASRELSPFWTTRFSFTYKQRQEESLANASANIIGLSLIYSHPGF